MPFPKSAQRKGGKAPATASQKAAALKWIMEHQPWHKSTGAQTPEGRLASSLNSQKGVYKKILSRKEGKNSEFEADIEREQAFLEAMCQKISDFISDKTLGSEVTRTCQRVGGKAVFRFRLVTINLSESDSKELNKILSRLKQEHYKNQA